MKIAPSWMQNFKTHIFNKIFVHTWAEDDSNAFIHEKWSYKYLISEVLKTVKLNEILLLYHMVLGGDSVHKYNFTSLDI